MRVVENCLLLLEDPSFLGCDWICRQYVLSKRQ